MTLTGEKSSMKHGRDVTENNASAPAESHTGSADAAGSSGFSLGASASRGFLPLPVGAPKDTFGSGGFAFGAGAPASAVQNPFMPAPAAAGFSFGGSYTAPSGGFSFGSTSASAKVPAPVPAPTSAKAGGSSRKKINRASAKSKAADSLEGYEHYRLFVDKLADSGVDDYVDLPMIAVMGDTSSGKSSLLSNISLVELPSSDTLTTRCPLRLQMRNAKSRKASVKVVWKDAPEGDDAEFAERTVGEDDWDTLAGIIGVAQEHIIAKTGREVARDLICVDVEGPHCENLTLVDLPGIVRSTGKFESSSVPGDIQALMEDYLNNERCIILAVHPSNVDFHNSQILAEAKKVDEDTKRTIPVLTKPDLIDDGAEMNVKDLLLGKKTDHFEMGFHMVKCRGQKDLNECVNIEDGLTKEDAFFRNKEPWRSVDDKQKFGTISLRVKLAGLQMKLIRESFEPIIAEMKERRDEAALELKNLGDIPSTLAEKRALFRKVRDEMREGLGSELSCGRISQLHSGAHATRPSAAFHMRSKAFQSAINCSKLANISSVQVGTAIIAVISGKEVRDTVCFVDKENDCVFVKSHIGKNHVQDDWKKKKVSGSVFKHKGNVYHAIGNGTNNLLQPIARKLARSNPEWLTELIEKNRPYNLPIFLNPDLFDAIVADQIKAEWESPIMTLLDFTAALMKSASDRFINDIKRIKSLPSLTGYLNRRSCEIVESITNDTLDELTKFIERERTPYTQNHYLFENLSKLRTQRLLDEVLSSVASYGGDDNKAPTDELSLDIQGIFERNQKRPIDDHMAEEMLNALDSYGKVAVKRFVDTVPMICVQILQRFPTLINNTLSDLTDSDIDALVVAPAGAVANMAALKKETLTLEKGIATFKEMSEVHS